jgi:prepilin-type N-terminal cleavage/methylation domain-containing protein
MKQKGFTLLEILLVIAAIGILAAIVIVAINPNRQLAQVRNAERQASSTTLADALNQYSIDNGSYPSSVTNNFQEICASSGGSGCLDITGELVPDYISAIPIDPNASGDGSGYLVRENDTNTRISVYAVNSELNQEISVNHQSWTPERIQEDLLIWLDADDQSTIISGVSGIETWQDKSGNSFHLNQITSNNQPQLEQRRLNNRSVVAFDGVNDLMTRAGTSVLGDGIVVFERSDWAMPVYQYTGASNRGFLGYVYPSFTTHNSYGINGGTLQNSNVNSAVGTPAMVFATNTLVSTPTSAMQLGWGTPNYQPLEGFIAELILFEGTLSNSDRQIVEGYLAHKWGLTEELPVSHPYRSIAEFLSI